MLRLNRTQNLLVIEKQGIRQCMKPQFKQVYEKCLHSYETRTSQQIQATNEQIQQLTGKNLARLNSIQNESISLEIERNKYSNCIFVCLSGLPAFKNEFEKLNLPGKTYQVISNGFQFGKDQEYRNKNLSSCKFSQNADKIHKILQQNPGKDVVFVYHSFGTYNLSVYFHKYGVERVKGLIQIGAAPIRQYFYITEMFNHTLPYTEQDIRRNKNDLAGKGLGDLIKRVNQQLNVVWENFPSVTYGASFLHYYKSPECPILFDLNRRYPNVLKLMIFGEDDNIFQQDLICERAHFYSKQQLNHQTELKEKFKQQYNTEAQNIQEKFIFMLPKGKHSLHLQKKNQPIIAKAVHEYLELIFS